MTHYLQVFDKLTFFHNCSVIHHVHYYIPIYDPCNFASFLTRIFILTQVRKSAILCWHCVWSMIKRLSYTTGWFEDPTSGRMYHSHK